MVPGYLLHHLSGQGHALGCSRDIDLADLLSTNSGCLTSRMTTRLRIVLNGKRGSRLRFYQVYSRCILANYAPRLSPLQQNHLAIFSQKGMTWTTKFTRTC